ncbi:O-antigen ligase family protein [Gemella cuniculi]|uniref:sunset domain-containing protein n=1 Tax=Gemella cuniculi TaxID=150240 RepID=UPI0004026CE0|nr:O-antigen ligase family protein [Gemella cuniculi]
MSKFIKEHGQIILWFVFIFFMLISLGMVFTHGVGYALVVFIPSIILLCPPIIRFIQKKTRLKKVVLGGISASVLMIAMFTTNHLSSAQKEEQLKNLQEKKEEREKKTEEQEEQRINDNQSTQPVQKSVTQNVETSNKKEVEKTNTVNKKVTVRASKKNKQYYIPGHPAYNNIAAKNLVIFNSEEAAIKAGYKKGK